LTANEEGVTDTEQRDNENDPDCETLDGIQILHDPNSFVARMHEPMNLPARRATQGSREALVTVENPPLVDVNYSSIVELRLQRAAQRECWAEVVRRLCMHNMGCKPDMGDGATHLPRSAKNRSAFHPQCAGDEFGQQCGRRRPVRDGEFITNCTWYLCLEPIRNTLSQKKIGWGAAPLHPYIDQVSSAVL
jgi:hypothetical protein